MNLENFNNSVDEAITNKNLPRSISPPNVGNKIKELGALLNSGKVDAAKLGSINGVATLDANGKIPASQIGVSPQRYKGVWNATTNTPELSDGDGEAGDTYLVVVPGSIDLGSGLISFLENDSAVLNDLLVWERVASSSIGWVNVSRFGAVPDFNRLDPSQFTDNTQAIANSISNGASILIGDKGAYYVSNFDNLKNINIIGEAKIFTDAPEGGYMQLNLNEDEGRTEFGQEYMFWFLRRYFTQNYARIIFSGDSTTAGTGVINGTQIFGLVNQMFIKDGFYDVGILNRGFAGQNVGQWYDLHLDADIAANPSLYILRWGINDSDRGADVFLSDLRLGLDRIRNVLGLGVEDLTILLMTPNSISNSENANDEAWIKSISRGIKKAARDYQCVFIDTFKIWNDSRSGKNIYYDNIGVHPNGDMNMLFASKIYDMVMPSYHRITGSKNKFYNEPNSFEDVLFTALPSEYKTGITINRAELSGGWPVDGFIITYKQPDGFCFQQNFGYGSRSQMYVRTSTIVAWNKFGSGEGYGATGDRPNPTDFNLGISFFDITLGKPIFSNGEQWVDASGNVV